MTITSTTGTVKTTTYANGDTLITSLATNSSLQGSNTTSNTFVPGTTGGNQIYGGKGADTVVYDNVYSNYTITPIYSGKTVTSYTVADKTTKAPVDTISATVDYLSVGGSGGTVVSLDNGKVNTITPSQTSTFAGNLANYSITKIGTSYMVQDLVGGSDKVLVAAGVNLKFADMTVNLAIQSQVNATPLANVQKVQELYIAFFNRIPDADGLSYWVGQFNAGQSINQIADTFYSVGAQYTALTGFSATMSNTDFINVIYKNVLGRSGGADAGGLTYWNAQLAGGTTRGALVSSILGSAHSFKGDATFGYVADLLDNKLAVAATFTTALGLGYASGDVAVSKGMAISAAVTPTSTDAALALIGVSPANLHLGG
jgi:hypothetical protein